MSILYIDTFFLFFHKYVIEMNKTERRNKGRKKMKCFGYIYNTIASFLFAALSFSIWIQITATCHFFFFFLYYYVAFDGYGCINKEPYPYIVLYNIVHVPVLSHVIKYSALLKGEKEFRIEFKGSCYVGIIKSVLQIFIYRHYPQI